MDQKIVRTLRVSTTPTDMCVRTLWIATSFPDTYFAANLKAEPRTADKSDRLYAVF